MAKQIVVVGERTDTSSGASALLGEAMLTRHLATAAAQAAFALPTGHDLEPA